MGMPSIKNPLKPDNMTKATISYIFRLLIGIALVAFPIYSVFEVEGTTWGMACVPMIVGILLMFSHRKLLDKLSTITITGPTIKMCLALVALATITSCSSVKPPTFSELKEHLEEETELVAIPIQIKVPEYHSNFRLRTFDMLPGQRYSSKKPTTSPREPIINTSIDSTGTLDIECICPPIEVKDTCIQRRKKYAIVECKVDNHIPMQSCLESIQLAAEDNNKRWYKRLLWILPIVIILSLILPNIPFGGLGLVKRLA